MYMLNTEITNRESKECLVHFCLLSHKVSPSLLSTAASVCCNVEGNYYTNLVKELSKESTKITLCSSKYCIFDAV